MAKAVCFYRALGFDLRHGGETESFTSFSAGRSYLNLVVRPAGDRFEGWGRVIFYVSDVDAVYRRAVAEALQPEGPPRDAPWGERYFHVRDPDGHELSFARPLSASSAARGRSSRPRRRGKP